MPVVQYPVVVAGAPGLGATPGAKDSTAPRPAPPALDLLLLLLPPPPLLLLLLMLVERAAAGCGDAAAAAAAAAATAGTPRSCRAGR